MTLTGQRRLTLRQAVPHLRESQVTELIVLSAAPRLAAEGFAYGAAHWTGLGLRQEASAADDDPARSPGWLTSGQAPKPTQATGPFPRRRFASRATVESTGSSDGTARSKQ